MNLGIDRRAQGVAMMLALAACAREDRTTVESSERSEALERETARALAPAHVPETWHTVREGAGHRLHLGAGVGCRACHHFDDDGAAVFSGVDCLACHPGAARSMHLESRSDRTPDCVDCHSFREAEAPSWSCTPCHASEGASAPKHLATHRSVPCSTCHQAHAAEPVSPPSCLGCHPAQEVTHGANSSCTACHAGHEPKEEAPKTCVGCHVTREAISASALFAGGHEQCASCHRPHAVEEKGLVACRTCHESIAVLKGKHQNCLSCHDPHQPESSPEAACARCHTQAVQHSGSAELDRCVSCHVPHPGAEASRQKARDHAVRLGVLDAASIRSGPRASAWNLEAHVSHVSARGQAARACTDCHEEASSDRAFHGAQRKVACADCHRPHEGGADDRALCGRCHRSEAESAARGNVHLECRECHQGPAHAAAHPAPACATCHAEEAATAKGHSDCKRCHDPHQAKPEPTLTCEGCHPAKRGGHHGADEGRCASCHRVHGPEGVAEPPACRTCHTIQELPALHQKPEHQACARCHAAHEETPRQDRDTCLACHTDQAQHEPTVSRCASCHPFE